MKYLILVLIIVIASSCSSITRINESQLDSDYYSFRQPGGDFSKVYVDTKDDSLIIIPIGENGVAQASVKPAPGQVLRKSSFDIDVLIMPFKYRFSTHNFPSQLTNEFNGNVFFGYRLDRYETNFVQTPVGQVKKLNHRAVTVGAFGGFGSTFISPWTTDYRTTDEYSGFILSKGLSAMMGIKNLTVGLGIGWDNLIDRDKDIWIYQNKAWYGLAVSLNLN